MLRLLYNLLMCPLSILVWPIFALHARGKLRLAERYGGWNLPPGEYRWFHAASLGEMQGLIPILKRYKNTSSHSRLLVTATSPTGLEKVIGLADECRLLPFDCWIWLRRAIRPGVTISSFVVAETELWPELLWTLSARGVPMALVNGIISDYSWGKYRLFGGLMKEFLRRFRTILVSSESSFERFVALGSDGKHTATVGNSKYDINPSIRTREKATELRAQFFSSASPVIVLGSLRPGEERVWFPCLDDAVRAGRVCLVVAPRHQEKFDYFAEALQRQGWNFDRWSTRAQQGRGVVDSTVVLLDTIGELERVYSFADMAFVGGTLEDWGGHNPLEPASYGACVVMGPYARNVQEIVDHMLANRAAILVRDTNEAGAALRLLLEEPARAKQYGNSAQEVWREYSGATERIFSALCAHGLGAHP